MIFLGLFNRHLCVFAYNYLIIVIFMQIARIYEITALYSTLAFRVNVNFNLTYAVNANHDILYAFSPNYNNIVRI